MIIISSEPRNELPLLSDLDQRGRRSELKDWLTLCFDSI